jgi:ABC-type branched-subunit amino acid transport system permease subunit
MAIFLVASGVTLIFGVLKIMNFSHGAFFMLGAYIAYSVTGDSIHSVSVLLLSCAIGGISVALCGLAVDKIVFARLRGLDEHNVLIATFALLMLFNGLVKLVWGLEYYSVSPPPALSGTIRLAGVIIPYYSLFIIASGLVIFVLLDIIIHRLWLGKILQSLVSDSWIVGILGYNVSALYTLTVMLAFFLAGAAGALLLANQTLSPGLSESYLLLGFVACIMGGLGNVRGAFAAALLLGLTESLSVVLLNGLPGLTVFVGMVLVILVRPQGLFARGGQARPDRLNIFFRRRALIKPVVVPIRANEPTYRDRQLDLRYSDHPKSKLTAIAAVLAIVLTISLPFWADPGLLFVAGLTLIEILFALSWNMLFGYAGVVSFGHAAFFALGAYGTGVALKSHAVALPFLAALVLVTLLGAILAAIVGAITLRRASGLYLAILTMALAEICRLIIGASPLLGRDDGLPSIPRPLLDFGFLQVSLATDQSYYWFLVIVVTVAGAILWWLANGRFGRALRCIHQDPDRARFIGLNVAGYRWVVFIVSGAAASLAGGLSAPWSQIVTPEATGILHSTAPMLNSLLGGFQSFWGPVVGTVIFAMMSYGTRMLIGISELVFGAVLLTIILAAPSGVIGLLHTLESGAVVIFRKRAMRQGKIVATRNGQP